MFVDQRRDRPAVAGRRQDPLQTQTHAEVNITCSVMWSNSAQCKAVSMEPSCAMLFLFINSNKFLS